MWRIHVWCIHMSRIHMWRVHMWRVHVCTNVTYQPTKDREREREGEMYSFRGVIVVSIVSAVGEVCIAYTSVLVNSWDLRHILDICKSIARLTKQPKLVPDIFSKSVPLVPSRGDANKRCQNTFQIERSNWKDLSSFAWSPQLGTKGTDLLKMSGTSFGCLVNRSDLVQISKNMPRVSWIDTHKKKTYQRHNAQVLTS